MSKPAANAASSDNTDTSTFGTTAGASGTPVTAVDEPVGTGTVVTGTVVGTGDDGVVVVVPDGGTDSSTGTKVAAAGSDVDEIGGDNVELVVPVISAATDDAAVAVVVGDVAAGTGDDAAGTVGAG